MDAYRTLVCVVVVVTMLIVPDVCKAHSKMLMLDTEAEKFNFIKSYLVDMFRYENPIERDHFYYVGEKPEMKFNRKFNFSDYHFDGPVARVLSVEGYELFVNTHPSSAITFMPVYHGYHQNLKHNYFSKYYEPRDMDLPIFYCSRKEGGAMANSSLWTLDGQPIDFVGDLGYDTVYTTELVERDLPDKEDYVMYRKLCNVWETIKPNISAQIKDYNETDDTMLAAHHIWPALIPVYQYFSEREQYHYYRTAKVQKAIDRANFINVVAYIIDPEMVDQIQNVKCAQKQNLSPLIRNSGGNNLTEHLFIGMSRYESYKEQYMNAIGEEFSILGWIPTIESDAAPECKGRYKLSIRWLEKPSALTKAHRLGNDVYIVPSEVNDENPLYYNQTFYVW